MFFAFHLLTDFQIKNNFKGRWLKWKPSHIHICICTCVSYTWKQQNQPEKDSTGEYFPAWQPNLGKGWGHKAMPVEMYKLKQCFKSRFDFSNPQKFFKLGIPISQKKGKRWNSFFHPPNILIAEPRFELLHWYLLRLHFLKYSRSSIILLNKEYYYSTCLASNIFLA